MTEEKPTTAPLSTMHLRCASALWRHQVEAEGHVWSPEIEIPQSVFAEAAVVIETLMKPSTEMVKAMITPVISQMQPWDPNLANVVRMASATAADQWIDGVRAILGREPPKVKTKPKPKLITLPGGRA